MTRMVKQKIRVLHLVNSFVLGGAERVVTMLATHMDRDHFEVIPCAIKKSGPLEEDLRASGVKYRVLDIRRRSIVTGPLFVTDLRKIILAVTQTVRDLSIDIIHAHLTENTLLAVLAARRTGIPRVCATVHNVIFTPQRGRLSLRGWLKQTAINKVFSQADRIIAVSGEVAHAVRVRTHIPRERIMTIPNGVEPDRFRFDGDRHVLRESLGLPTNRLVAISIGRLSRQKGYSYLQGALTLIPAGQRPLMLVVGDGPDRHELELKAATLGLAQDIRFLGHRRDVPALLAAADIFVLSSLWEGLPLVLLEAMAAGLPAVITAVGGNPEVMEEGKSGLLVPPADERALASALTNLLQNPLRRESMGKAARERFDRCFSLHSFIAAHENLYEQMLAEPSVSTNPATEQVHTYGLGD